jgi:hypothetical protein
VPRLHRAVGEVPGRRPGHAAQQDEQNRHDGPPT